MIVPQRPYTNGENRKDWVPKPSILFSTQGRPGVSLLDAVSGMLERMDEEENPPFDESCGKITIRMHVSSQGHSKVNKVVNLP